MKSMHWFLINFCVLSITHIYLVNASDDNVKLSFTPRIIGGRKAHKGEFLGIVSIQTWKGQHFCGGTWFRYENLTQILTAAHCVVDKKMQLLDKSLLQVMGNDLTTAPYASPSRQVRKIRKIVSHPYYNPTNFINDIAILFLAEPFEETKEFAPIQLPNRAIFDYQFCNVAGWGYLVEEGVQSNDLMATNVSVIPRKICLSRYSGKISRHAFCAGSLEGEKEKDTCQGDSGGGLLSNNILIGVVSSGIGCGRRDYPGIYTNVHHYNHWIRQEINSSPHSFASHLVIFAEIFVVLLLWRF